MDIKYIIFRNLKKNIKNYFLYIFALIFSVALYFSFVTLQYDPAMDEMKETVKGAAAIQVGSVLLVLIVTIFLLYANNLFIKRRGKEIGLFQLIGMTKGKIFRILSAENLILYFGSLIIGVFLGFSVSKLIMMILFKLTDIDVMVTLSFSAKALIQTVTIFAFIYLFIMLTNFLFINRHSILSLFQSTSVTEEKVKKLSVFSIITGILGIGFILLGYYISTQLLKGYFPGYKLIFAMLAIIGSIIIGTYCFYRGSVSFIFNLIRKKQDGYVTLNNVLSLSSIMFRMKSNAMLLTIITLTSTLTMTLLSLTYISYYSVEKLAEELSPNDFSLFSLDDVDDFTSKLKENKIEYSIQEIELIQVYADITGSLVSGSYEHLDIGSDPITPITVISDQSIPHIDVPNNDVFLTDLSESLQQLLTFSESGSIEFYGNKHTINANFIGMTDEVLPFRLTEGFSIAIVSDDIYEKMAHDLDPTIQDEFPLYIGIDIANSRDLKQANDIFQELELNKWQGMWEGYESRLEITAIQKQGVGLTMFIVGFLGLTFLITSGCILYFKQMDESEAEKANYTILRKLGFTHDDLLRGIRIKQLINFGIPLVVGLCHSYFAIKSGWFIFGSEMWTPTITVVLLYILLYSTFGLLSIQHYKHVLQDEL